MHPMSAILVAEDDPALRLFLERVLRRDGHKVVCAADGDEAYRHLQKRSFDLLLTDVAMPASDGLDLAQRARALYPEMQVVFITGFSGIVYATDPAARVISKPFHLRDITAEVGRCLGKPPEEAPDAPPSG